MHFVFKLFTCFWRLWGSKQRLLSSSDHCNEQRAPHYFFLTVPSSISTSPLSPCAPPVCETVLWLVKSTDTVLWLVNGSHSVYYSPSGKVIPQLCLAQAGQGKSADTRYLGHSDSSHSPLFSDKNFLSFSIFFSVFSIFSHYFIIFRSLFDVLRWCYAAQLSCSQGYSSQASFQRSWYYYVQGLMISQIWSL